MIGKFSSNTPISVLVIVLLCLAGCENEDSSVVELMLSGDIGKGSPMAAMVEEYNQTKPNVKVKILEYSSSSEVKKTAKERLEKGNPPELIVSTGIKAYRGKLSRLDALQTNHIPKPVLTNIQLDGQIYAIPLNQTVNGLIYNKDLFSAAGVSAPALGDEPWTWEEFTDALTRVVERTEARYGLVMDRSEQRFKTLFYQHGGGLFSDNGTPTLNTPENRLAMNMFIDLHENDIMPEDIWLGGADSSDIFKTGTVAALYSGSWRLLDYHKNLKRFDWGVTFLPKNKTRSSATGGNFMVAFKDSNNEQGAKEFIYWLSRSENMTQYISLSGDIPAYDNLNPSYSYRQQDLSLLLDETRNLSEKLLMDGQHFAKYKPLSNILRAEAIRALKGEITVEQALLNTEGEYKQRRL